MYSFEKDVTELQRDLEKIKNSDVEIKAYGNTTRLMDSYVWELAKKLREEKESGNEQGIYDLVYLDGAHTLIHDAPACCILKKLVKVGGVMILDDINWSFAKSPTMNPNINPSVLTKYTEEQVETCQVQMVIELFMEDDENWQRIDATNKSRALYKRLR